VETTSSKLEARDYVRIILRRWWFILVVALAATLVGGIIAVAMPKTYRAVATVVVPEQQQGVLLMGGQQKTEDFALETQALIAGGNEVAIRTAKTLAEGSLGPKIIVDPSEVTKAITTEAVKPNLIRIQAVHETQLWAREFANQTAMSFLDVMEEVRKIADGRVFTGRQALKLGLVDILGDYRDAIELAGKLGGIKGEPQTLERKRKKLTLWDLLFGDFEETLRRLEPSRTEIMYKMP